jgi:hypothetical protein
MEVEVNVEQYAKGIHGLYLLALASKYPESLTDKEIINFFDNTLNSLPISEEDQKRVFKRVLELLGMKF